MKKDEQITGAYLLALACYHDRIPAYQVAPQHNNSQLNINQSFEGETIEQRVEKIMHNNEPITDGAPQIYTERQDGVIPEYNVRDDKWDRAIDMTTEITTRNLTDRQKRINERIKGKTVEKTPEKPNPQEQTPPEAAK